MAKLSVNGKPDSMVIGLAFKYKVIDQSQKMKWHLHNSKSVAFESILVSLEFCSWLD